MMPKNEKNNLNSNIRAILRSLNYRNYRLFFSGQFVSMSGTWIQQVAMSWLVYHLTNSAFMLGLVTFLSQVPNFFFAPFAGVYVDRWNKHRTLIFTQAVSMLQAFALAALTLTGNIKVWHIMLLSVMLGLTNAFDMPVRQAFVIEMIEDRKDLGNAIALNSSLVNMTRLIGPAVAGIIVAKFGEGICFMVNGVTFIAVIIALLFMRIKKTYQTTIHRHVLAELKEGLRYSFGFPPIRDMLILLAVLSFATMQYTVLMPVFAKDILKGGSDTLGFLMASTGVGALIGGIYLASRKNVLGLGKIMAICTFLFSATIIIFAFSKNFILSMIILLFAGFGFIALIATSNTILQTITDDDKRGRVMSFFTMAFMGMAPFGSLAAGAVANKIGGPLTIMISGIISLICGVILTLRLPALRKIVRPVYIKKGIIPEVAKGLQAATDFEGRPEL
ncbi:MAG: MFS transporter [Actinobacteria bacterium]|nr:MFS transporter [Actinomycetota bacterium]